MNNSAVKVIRRLNQNGHEAYLVGGCVRNYLMGIEPADYDIASSADVDDVKKLFEFRVIGSGEVHGTLLVLVDGVDHHIEVTSYRDGALTLEQDLSHRDFTINAIAYHPEKGIIDPFNGADDIRNKIIRCVIDAHARFHEDPLRILRALRFASVFGFEIADETSTEIFNLRSTINFVSPERIESELTKIICGQDSERILREYHDVFAAVIPELNLNSNAAHLVGASVDVPAMRWAYLFCETEPAKISGVMERLRFDKRRKNSIEFLIGHRGLKIPDDRKTMRHYISEFGHDDCAMLLEFLSAFHDVARAVELLREVESEDSCLSIKDLAVNGHDVMSLGFSGREIGNALSLLLEAVIDERVKNDRDELLEFLRYAIMAQKNQ